MGANSTERKINGVWDFEFYKIVSYSVNSPSGQKLLFRVINCPDWVNVLAVTDDGQVILAKQFRHALGKFTVELPGGIVDTGTDPLVAAQQELLEESGYQGGDWIFLGKYLANPGLQNNFIYSYFCKSPALIAQPAPDEQTDVVLMPIEEALKEVFSGSLAQAFSMAAFHLALARGLLR